MAEHPKRDDKSWLRHSLIWRERATPRIEYLPVRMGKFKPEERRY